MLSIVVSPSPAVSQEPVIEHASIKMTDLSVFGTGNQVDPMSSLHPGR